MSWRKSLLLTAIMLGLLGGLVGLSLGRSVSRSQALPLLQASASVAPAVAEGIPADMGIEATLTSVPSQLSTSDAVSRVEASFPGIATQASSVSAAHVMFTAADFEGTLPGTSIVPRNVSAWMVTFHGVVHVNNGPPGDPQPATSPGYSRTVFIDAATGQQLMVLEYPPGH